MSGGAEDPAGRLTRVLSARIGDGDGVKNGGEGPMGTTECGFLIPPKIPRLLGSTPALTQALAGHLVGSKTPSASGERVRDRPDWRNRALDVETYVDAIDAWNSRGAGGPRGPLHARGTSLTKTAHAG